MCEEGVWKQNQIKEKSMANFLLIDPTNYTNLFG